MSGRIAAILAGGRGLRMGEEKALLQLDSQTFLERVAAVVGESFETVVVAGGETSLPGSVNVHDLVPGAGPVGGLASVLDHGSGADVFIAAVDMPLISSETVERLSRPALLRGQARVARVEGRLQPLCGMYATDLLPLALEQLEAEDRSMMAFLGRVPHLTLIDITDGSLRNINTPEEYEALVEEFNS